MSAYGVFDIERLPEAGPDVLRGCAAWWRNPTPPARHQRWPRRGDTCWTAASLTRYAASSPVPTASYSSPTRSHCSSPTGTRCTSSCIAVCAPRSGQSGWIPLRGNRLRARQPGVRPRALAVAGGPTRPRRAASPAFPRSRLGPRRCAPDLAASTSAQGRPAPRCGHPPARLPGAAGFSSEPTKSSSVARRQTRPRGRGLQLAAGLGRRGLARVGATAAGSRGPSPDPAPTQPRPRCRAACRPRPSVLSAPEECRPS